MVSHAFWIFCPNSLFISYLISNQKKITFEHWYIKCKTSVSLSIRLQGYRCHHGYNIVVALITTKLLLSLVTRLSLSLGLQNCHCLYRDKNIHYKISILSILRMVNSYAKYRNVKRFAPILIKIIIILEEFKIWGINVELDEWIIKIYHMIWFLDFRMLNRLHCYCCWFCLWRDVKNMRWISVYFKYFAS